MKIQNRNPEILVPTWLVGRFGPETSGDGPLDGAFIVKATFQIGADGALVPREGGPLQPEGDRWIDDDPSLGLAHASDFVPVKPRGEYTVVGTAHRPRLSPANQFAVAVEVAGRRKELMISGPRVWQETLFGHRPGAPGYVERQPLTYAAALGGPQDPANPIGVGRAVEAMPRIEDADHPITSPRADAEPAGFGPLDRAWRQRRLSLGAAVAGLPAVAAGFAIVDPDVRPLAYAITWGIALVAILGAVGLAMLDALVCVVEYRRERTILSERGRAGLEATLAARRSRPAGEVSR